MRTTWLHWLPNSEPDLSGYWLYRDTTKGFIPDASHLLSAVGDTGYVDAAGALYLYKLSAMDACGNESLTTLLSRGTSLDAPLSAAPSPDPMRLNTGSMMRFGIPQARHVTLAIHDASGHCVRTVLADTRESGEYVVHFNGSADNGQPLSPGIWFARLETPQGRLARRFVRMD